jgi:hypothetical protein
MYKIRYELVRLIDGSRVILQVHRETDTFLVGDEVETNGDLVSGRFFDTRSHLIDKTQIDQRTPLVMNRTYAVLEPVVEARQ